MILAFDTSAAHCAAALLSGGTVLAAREEPMATGQAERLVPLLGEVLAEGGAAWRDLDALAVGTGPGNFTGVRIGVALARGLALGLGVPAIGVTAFEAWAMPGAMVVRDARLGQVHVLMPGASDPVTLDLDALPPLPHGTPVLGDLAAEAAARTGGRAVAAPPLAPAIGRVALGRLHGANPRPAPLYLRAPDAAPARPAPPVLP